MGSSGSSLHSKTFSVDRSRVFIGSFNFDPRSARLNTEMDFVIDSPALAQKIEAAFNSSIDVIGSQPGRRALSFTGVSFFSKDRHGGSCCCEKEFRMRN